MVRSKSSFGMCAAFLVSAACASVPSPLDRVAEANATIINAAGDERGTAELWQDRDKIVHVEVQVMNMPPGPHGIHFHAVGK